MAEFYGLDISEFQGNVDFNALKNEGYTFVILRINSWSNIYNRSVPDTKFESNYNAAKKAGLNVGAYWFTYANTVDYAELEAKTCLEWIKGKKFEYPIYLDIERKEQFDQGKAFCNNLICNFCNTLEAAGYFVGVYCSTYWFTNFVDENVRERYSCWIAQWSTRCTYTGSYGVWQNGTARTKGIAAGMADVDHDISYVDYPSLIISKGFNGYSERVLDDKTFLILGQTTAVCYVVKKIINSANKMKIINVPQTNTLTYDYAAQRGVNALLEKWGYKPNGNVNKGFFDEAWKRVLKG